MVTQPQKGTNPAVPNDLPDIADLRMRIMQPFFRIVQIICLIAVGLCLVMIALQSTRAFVITIMSIPILVETGVATLGLWLIGKQQSEQAVYFFAFATILNSFIVGLLLHTQHLLIILTGLMIMLSVFVSLKSFPIVMTVLSIFLYSIATFTELSLHSIVGEQDTITLSINIITVCGSLIGIVGCVYLIGQQMKLLVNSVRGLALTSEQLRLTEQDSTQQLNTQLEEQQRLFNIVQSLEVPIIPLRDGMIVVPLLSYLDQQRMDAIEQRVLAFIKAHKSHTVILEMTGVPTIDSYAARRLMKMARSIRLLGAEAVLSGLHPDIAMVLSRLDIDFKEIQVFISIQDVLLYQHVGVSER